MDDGIEHAGDDGVDADQDNIAPDDPADIGIPGVDARPST
jgi:hypothetical protein